MAKICKYIYVDDSESIMPRNRFISRKMTSLPHPLLFIQTSYINKKVNLLKKSRRWGSNTFERILSVKFIVLDHQIINTNASTYTPNSNGYSSLSKY